MSPIRLTIFHHHLGEFLTRAVKMLVSFLHALCTTCAGGSFAGLLSPVKADVSAIANPFDNHLKPNFKPLGLTIDLIPHSNKLFKKYRVENDADRP